MVLKLVQAAADRFFPSQYAYHILIGIITVTALRAFARGRTTNRERDLHNRTFLVTGGFTPLGLTLLQDLASRGAKVIALSPYPIDSPNVTILVSLLRTTYNNENIFAERCDLANSADVRKFCMQFLTEGEEGTKSQPNDKEKEKEKPGVRADSRLDGIIFAHEYQHLGVPNFLRTRSTDDTERQRESDSLATFLMTTLLLPALLVAPVERDIRIINIVNPFYAAASAAVRTSKAFDPTFKLLTPLPPSSTSSTPSPLSRKNSVFLTEGLRSLRTIIFTRHLQRIFDALPKPQIPKTEEGTSSVPIISGRMQRSNIVAISVSPGISRVDTVSRLLNADWNAVETEENVGKKFSWIGVLLYILLLPLLYISTKSPKFAIQSILHALFLPTPFKVLSQAISSSSETESKSQSANDKSTHDAKPRTSTSQLTREELLKPGALYAECAIVRLDLAVPAPPLPEDKTADSTKGKGKEKEKGGKGLKEEVLQIEDDGEYGGEIAGRMVWEAYEAALKVWERDSGSDGDGQKDGEAAH
ncbi:hypothetical protein P691DRAFT_734164 [Macrolepiota fuliginosa MF-IS2]|uniref:Ketoreductase (KR) domain-containing protein n=1 Tax=Macrolepiota fuliginosa MF-IS2 TaxID=1400762 RepID=A0A9P5X8A8_9AGAR|nr:hypothetical protein P691DRAFT_734164 [Macrolepiota fuliginosa MF-IS2]